MQLHQEQQLTDDQFYLWVVEVELTRNLPRITRWVCCRQTGSTATVIYRGGKKILKLSQFEKPENHFYRSEEAAISYVKAVLARRLEILTRDLQTVRELLDDKTDRSIINTIVIERSIPSEPFFGKIILD